MYMEQITVLFVSDVIYVSWTFKGANKKTAPDSEQFLCIWFISFHSPICNKC